MEIIKKLGIAILITLTPLLVVLLGSIFFGFKAFSENSGLGSVLWFTFISVPIALLYLMLSTTLSLAKSLKSVVTKLDREGKE